MRRISIIFLSLLVSITGLSVISANADALADGCYGVYANGAMRSVYQLDGPGCEGAIVIDSSVQSIDYATYIYQGPNKITSISIPAETTFISYYPFNFVTDALEEFIVDIDNPNFSSVDGVLYNKDQTRLISYPGGKLGDSFTVPSTVTEIDMFAFSSSFLKTVNIGENVVVIGSDAFSMTGHQSLQEIIVSADNGYYSSLDGVLFNKDLKTLIHYPKEKNNLSYTVPVTVTTIQKIQSNPYLQSITLPNLLTTLGQYALAYSALTSLHIPDSVTSYGPFPTFASSQLQFFTVGQGSDLLKVIDDVLYSKDGTHLIEYPGGKSQSIFTIPSGVITLENQWLSGYVGLEKIVIPSSVTEIIGGFYFPVVVFEGDSNLVSADYFYSSQVFYCGAANSVLDAIALRPNVTVECVIPTILVPDAPTIGTATALSPTSASISFTAPTNNGGAIIETYTAISTGGSLTGRVLQPGSGSITITGLSPSTPYTFRVTASNSAGTSSPSDATISITMPASAGDLAAQAAAQAAARVAAEKAAVKAAEEKLELEKKSARGEIVRKINLAEKLSIETFIKAEIPGVTTKNLDAVQAEILTLPEKSRSDLTEVMKIARKFEVVGYIASSQPNSIYPSRLVEIGLIPADSKFKSAITVALKNLPASERSTFADIKVAIEKEMARIQVRKDRLSSLVARVSGRK